MPSADFVHLRLHSEYDVRKGAARIAGDDNVIDAAAAGNQPALALTDTGCLFGAVKFYANCRARGVKPLIGCEVRVDDDHAYYLLLLVADNTGYGNLCRLLSRAYDNKGWVRPAWLTAKTTEGLIALSAARRGEIGALTLRGRRERALQAAQKWADKFPGRFYLEVWRAGGDDEVQTSVMAEIARQSGLPLVATHPVQCAREKDLEMLNVRLCIATGRHLSDRERERPLSDAPYLLSAEQMHEKFADLPGALQNTLEIAKRCNFMFEFGRTHLPALGGGGENSAAELTRLAQDGLKIKLPKDLPPARRADYEKRLAYEISVITDMGFADYFLIVMDFIRWAKGEDIPVGPGRGSGAGSLAAYALDITALDPLQYGLLFERFLNPQRVSMPDFDVDFCVDGRDRVIDYVKEKYGEKQVSQIVTFGTIGARGAIRDVGRVLGFPYGYSDRIARAVPDGISVKLSDALKESADLAEEYKSEDGARLINLALKMEGLPRNIGTHAGGVLITPKPLEEYCPRYVAADTQTLVSQFDMNDIEKIGLVKFDFLGLRTLTILDNAVRQLPDGFSLETTPLDDDAVYQQYRDGDVIGVFQCESAGMRDLMRRLRPDRFEDIIALMALFRPGPLSSGDTETYIRRKHMNGGWEGEVTPCLLPALGETYGIFVYQEQVMRVAGDIAGYKPGEADLLRRAMGKKKEDEMAAQRVRFVQGAAGKLSATAAADLFEKISGFAGYGFNKSHAAAYAILSYRTAYLKAHYPAAFLAAVLSAESGDSERVRLVIDCAKKGGIAVRGPDINAGGRDFRVEEKNTLRYGLSAVKGLGDGAIAEIELRRGKRPFSDLFDFCERMEGGQLGGAMAESLADAGAFDSLHPNRAAVKATLPAVMTQKHGSGLFGANAGLADTPMWTARQKLTAERRALGFCLSGSFYELSEKILEKLPLMCRDFSKELPLGDGQLAGVLMRIFETRKMRAGGFGVAVIADKNGEVELRADARMLKPLRGLPAGEGLLVAEANVRRGREGGTAVRALRMWSLDDFLAERLQRLLVRCAPDILVDELLADGMPPKAKNGGGAEIVLCYDDGALSFNFTLGGGWAADRLAVERLQQFAGVKEVDLDLGLIDG